MSSQLLNARFLIQSASGTGPSYTANGKFYDNTSTWVVGDVTVGDQVFDEQARRYEITNIITQTGTTLEVDVNDLDGAGNAPALGNGVVYRPTTNFGFPLTTTEQNGITEYLKEFIRNNSVIDIDAAIKAIQDQNEQIEQITITAPDISVGYVELMYAPQLSRGMSVQVLNGGLQEYAVDYSITNSNRVTFAGEFATLLEAGDKLVVTYSR